MWMVAVVILILTLTPALTFYKSARRLLASSLSSTASSAASSIDSHAETDDD